METNLVLLGVSLPKWSYNGWKWLHYIGLRQRSRNSKLVLEIITMLPHVLPCKICARHALCFIQKADTLTETTNMHRLLVDLHNDVNNRNRKGTITYREAMYIHQTTRSDEALKSFTAFTFAILFTLPETRSCEEEAVIEKFIRTGFQLMHIQLSAFSWEGSYVFNYYTTLVDRGILSPTTTYRDILVENISPCAYERFPMTKPTVYTDTVITISCVVVICSLVICIVWYRQRHRVGTTSTIDAV